MSRSDGRAADEPFSWTAALLQCASCRGEAPLLRYASVLDEIWCNRWTLARDTRHQLDCTRGCPRRLQVGWTDARGGGRTARVGCPRRLQAGWRYCRGEQLAGTTSRETEAGDTPTRSLGE